MTRLRLGLLLGYWAADKPADAIERAQEAERLGYDSVWVSESWGNDAFTYAAWIASHTSTIKIGTAVVQLAARTPTATAMATATLDHISEGRFVLGLGVSGPQVVEGWYGQPSDRPLARTREYVDVIRAALRRDEPLRFDGDHYQFPYRGPGSVGLGKPLRLMTHPRRAAVPIFIGAEGPKNIAQTAAIADGWLPLYYSPHRQDVYADQLRGVREGFEIASPATVVITDDVAAGLRPVKSMLGFYIGGMGAKGQNYHTKLMQRMGFDAEALRVQDLFLAGDRDGAVAAVPDRFADEISLVGPPERIRERLAAWQASPVTALLVGAADVAQVRRVADVIMG